MVSKTVDITGASGVTSTGIIALFLEVAYKLQAGEEALTTNPNVLTININDDAKIVTILATLPLSINEGTNGAIEFSATNYTNQTFTPGTGDLDATTIPALFLELAGNILQLEDLAFQVDNTFVSRMAVTIDASIPQAAISMSVPYTTTLVSGKPTLNAVDYLP